VIMDDKVINIIFDLQRKVERLGKRVSELERRGVPVVFDSVVVDKVVDKVVDN
jgi:hypothetical protein